MYLLSLLFYSIYFYEAAVTSGFPPHEINKVYLYLILPMYLSQLDFLLD